MRYSNLPIDGANGLTRENVERFDKLVAAAGDAPTLIHCGSGNRVGALIALRAANVQGQPIEKAIETGRSWGLKGLEPAVREQLAAVGCGPWPQTQPARRRRRCCFRGSPRPAASTRCRPAP